MTGAYPSLLPRVGGGGGSDTHQDTTIFTGTLSILYWIFIQRCIYLLLIDS